jgi:basic membrane lipoprotein Med (substrate-binding protein (PBP1-ABC) superfamily)
LDQSNLQIELQEWNEINDEFKAEESKESSKVETITDIKNTKSHILFLTGFSFCQNSNAKIIFDRSI